VILGCAMPEAEQGLNVARIASLRAGIPVTASAVTVNRFCASVASHRFCSRASRVLLVGRRRRRDRINEPVPMGGQCRAESDSGRSVPRRTDDGLVAENHACNSASPAMNKTPRAA
jgi:hypothetical protein